MSTEIEYSKLSSRVLFFKFPNTAGGGSTMDGCHNDILAPLILAVMVANGHPLTLDEIVDELTAVINSQTELAVAPENIGDGKHGHKSFNPRRKC